MNDNIDVVGNAMSEEHQHLTFFVDNETFAIAVLEIKEIIEYASITRVPHMNPFMLGITNIRGKVISVIDLALRLDLMGSDTSHTCIIVETIDDGEMMEIGLIVESVDQVYPLPPEVKEATPNFGTRIRRDFIKSMAKVNDKFITILDLKTLLAIDELSENRYESQQGVRHEC